MTPKFGAAAARARARGGQRGVRARGPSRDNHMPITSARSGWVDGVPIACGLRRVGTDVNERPSLELLAVVSICRLCRAAVFIQRLSALKRIPLRRSRRTGNPLRSVCKCSVLLLHATILFTAPKSCNRCVIETTLY